MTQQNRETENQSREAPLGSGNSQGGPMGDTASSGQSGMPNPAGTTGEIDRTGTDWHGADDGAMGQGDQGNDLEGPTGKDGSEPRSGTTISEREGETSRS